MTNDQRHLGFLKNMRRWTEGVGLFLMLAALLPAEAAADRQGRRPAGCYAAYGQTACGYDCTAGYGQLKCAQTPTGTCTAAYGSVTCWDPAPAKASRRRSEHGGRERRGRDHEPAGVHDAPTCLSNYGQTACGYGCVAQYGRVQCATTPGAQCIAQYGQIACGYGCVAQYGQVRCAQGPHGQCHAASGSISCFDP
ncbi:MAG: hypothetical protein IPL79_19100 [Myxococcales bacterium]|nr:hypothetical protein [Myxococcales bacterium]